MHTIRLAALLALLFTVGCTMQSTGPRAGDAPVQRTIRTSGTATVYAKPDFVNLKFAVHTFDGDLTKAKQLNDTAARQVLQLLQTLGVEERDIQTEAMRSDRVEEEMPDRHK